MDCRTSAVGALTCYASGSYVLGTSLSHIPPVLLVPLYTGVIFFIALLRLSYVWTTGVHAPPAFGMDYLWLIGTGVILYTADIFYMKAISSSLTTTTIIASMLPIVVAIIKLILTGEPPTWRQGMAFMLGISAVAILVYE